MATTTLPGGSTITPEQLARAEALVAAELGLATLAPAQVTEQGSVGAGGMIHLTRPASAITTLTLNGMPAVGVLATPTALDVGGVFRATYGTPWGYGYARAAYAVEYTAGWAPGTLPDGVTQAVLMTAEALAAGQARGDVTSEQMGPVKYTYAQSAQGLAGDALGLLAAFRPLRV